MQLTLKDAFVLAAKHDAAGRSIEARAVYDEILAAMPDHPGALLRIGQQQMRVGDAAGARERFERALDEAERQSLPLDDIRVALLRAQFAQRDLNAARAAISSLLASAGERAGLPLKIGGVALDAGEGALAEQCFRRTVSLAPDSSGAAVGLALALAMQRKLDEARQVALRAIELAPTATESFRVLAYVEQEHGRHDDAQRVARSGLEQHPEDVELLQILGRALRSTGAVTAAAAVLRQAAALAPANPGVLKSLGAVSLDLDDGEAAVANIQRAIELGASEAETWDNLGVAHRLLANDEQALLAFEQAHRLAPTLTPALANLVYVQQNLCEWDRLDESERQLTATLDDPASDPRWSPFIALAMPLSSAQQLQVACRWSDAMLPPAVPARRASPARGRLRVGYLSGSFHEHPTARLMVGLFEQHDKTRFEVTGYSYGPDDGSAVRARVRSAFEHWRDVRDLSDADIARTIRDDNIDVLIERKGHTQGGRMGILASRPAPVQIHYMSFPGTLGYAAIDGVIADADVVPVGDERFFSERVWRLPRSYYVNDSARGLPVPTSRRANGLPENALVLACLNGSYKLRRPFFSIWMEALRLRSDAVLWLFAGPARSQQNLRAEAQRLGVDPARLVFAPRINQDAHMARLACADLALDTLPYGAHTTGVDVLWAGVPMLTCRGETFPGRVGASLLKAARMDKLIAPTVEEYRALLLDLVFEPAVINDYRLHLAETRAANALFDTAGFARDWEALLLQIHADAVGATA